MTTPFHQEPGALSGPVPPPECPARGLGIGPGGLRRLYGPEAEKDPAGLYDKLRAEHGAVAPVLLHGDVPAWLVLGHSENLHMTRTPSQFSRDSRRWRALQDGSVAADHPLAPIFTWQPVCVFADGANHERQRGAVTDSMERIDSRGVRRHINRFSNRLVNDFCEKGTADLVSQFAEHLPMMVVCAIFGMPEEYDDALVQAARDMIRGTETAVASNAHVVAVLTRLVEQRRAESGPDLASWLLEHPASLTDIEVIEHLRLILIAAYESTTNLMANVLRMVLTDPRFRARLSGGHMTVPEAVEQTLWDEPPFTAVFGRWAVGDTELGGQQIKAGDGLLVGIAAANTDPKVRPDLAAGMEGNRAHLAFSGGPHECPGQDIGRAIADVGVDALLMRLPDLELGVDESELRWVGNIMSRHLVELPATFAPSPQQAVDSDPLSMMARSRPAVDWEVSSPSRPVPLPTSTEVGTQPAHAPGVVPYQELPEALPEEVPEALPVEPAVVPEAGPVAGGPVEPAVPPPAVPQPAAPAEEPAVAPVIPQQRGTAAPARLWRAVSRWWNGD
ncbi:cytochrome P450 [Streptomyces sp. NPDC079020]|uniref:cytochrome P450 n=1 Tax=Streptomyces sp. NPDC079020 TaxID=3365722 RepID=UPI0037D06ACB